MKKQWITSTTPNSTEFLISPVGVPTVVVPVECIATDNDKLIYSTIDKYNGVLHRTMVTEDSVGDLFVHNLFVSYRPWAWDKKLEVTGFSGLKISVNKTYGCFVTTSYGRVYVNTLVGQYFDKKGRYENQKYIIKLNQGGKFGCLVPKNGQYK